MSSKKDIENMKSYQTSENTKSLFSINTESENKMTNQDQQSFKTPLKSPLNNFETKRERQKGKELAPVHNLKKISDSPVRKYHYYNGGKKEKKAVGTHYATVNLF